MSYPPEWRRTDECDDIIELVTRYPFAHLITAKGGLKSTRIPFIMDSDNGKPVRLRGHLNGNNPQARIIDASQLMIVFSGPSTYVSPNWRTDLYRGPTFDYQEVRIHGTASAEPGIGFFTQLVDDLANQIEPQYSEVGDYPIWQSSMTPDGYIERLLPHVTSFTVTIESIEMISKLHQQFPKEDRQSIADHLSKSSRTESREIAERIRQIDR